MLVACTIGCASSPASPPLHESYGGALEPLDANGTVLRDQLRADVEVLAGQIRERSVLRPKGLHAGADRSESVFVASGLSPQRQPFTVEGAPCDNVEAEIAPTDRSHDVVIIGAHYDSVAFTTGANDNASGTGAMLTLASTFATGSRAPLAGSLPSPTKSRPTPRCQHGVVGQLRS